MAEITALQPIKFNYKKGNLRNLPTEKELVGFIAQDVQKFFPETVNQGEDGFLDFNIHAINVAMVNAIKELNNENNQLKSRVDELEQRLEKMESLVKSVALK